MVKEIQRLALCSPIDTINKLNEVIRELNKLSSANTVEHKEPEVVAVLDNDGSWFEATATWQVLEQLDTFEYRWAGHDGLTLAKVQGIYSSECKAVALVRWNDGLTK